MLHPYSQADRCHCCHITPTHPSSLQSWPPSQSIMRCMTGHPHPLHQALLFPCGTQSNGGLLRLQHLQDLCLGSSHHSPGLTAPASPHPPLPPPSTSLLHPALTLTLPVAVLGDKIASGHLWAGGFIPGRPLNFAESFMWGRDRGAPRWLCWGKQRVWVLCHKPGL